jgi:diguanylate cyclase (GGDEF)-like protein
MGTAQLSRLLFGTEPRLRRAMFYFGATAILYAIFVTLFLAAPDEILVRRAAVLDLAAFTSGALLTFYVLIRASGRLGMAPTTLAVLQGVFGITCNMWGYAVAGPLRGATLMGLMVVVVFCTFALRPRQTLLLAGFGLLGMGATMWWHHAQDPVRYPAAVEAVTFSIMAACSLSVTLLTGEMSKLRARLKAKREALEKAVEAIRTLATIDELTALANRRHMNEVLAQEERRRGPAGMPAAGKPDRITCIALLDIDFFKQINDRHGHAAGDEVLRSFAAAARAELRAGDVLARWGGEEFLLMLPDTEEQEAQAVLERIRASVGALRIDGLADGRRVSFSAGLTARRGTEAMAGTINRADKALYQAKSSGRDRVVRA